MEGRRRRDTRWLIGYCGSLSGMEEAARQLVGLVVAAATAVYVCGFSSLGF